MKMKVGQCDIAVTEEPFLDWQASRSTRTRTATVDMPPGSLFRKSMLVAPAHNGATRSINRFLKAIVLCKL